jgi:hypothetical protein
MLYLDLFFPSLSGLFVSRDMRFLFYFSPRSCSFHFRMIRVLCQHGETTKRCSVTTQLRPGFFNVLSKFFDVRSFQLGIFTNRHHRL